MICCIVEATSAIQKMNSGEVNGLTAAAESEIRQLKEEIAVLHRVVAGT